MSEQPLPKPFTERAIELTVEIVHRRIRVTGSKEKDSSLLALLVDLLRRYRMYTIHHQDHIDAIWERIRANEDHVDFIMTCTNEFLFRYNTEPANYDKLCKALDAAYTHMHDVEACYIDKALRSRLPPKEEFYQVLVNNPWLTFLLLCEIGMVL